MGTRMSTRRRAAVVLAAAAGTALAGCSALPSERAATVNGEVVAESDLQEATEEFNTAAQQPIAPSDMLSVLVQLPVIDDLAPDAGVDFTREEYVRALREAGINNPNDLTVDYLRGVSTLQVVGAELPTEQLAELDVEVNPRYGSWDPQQAAVVTNAPEWVTPEADSASQGQP